ncbi:hypothetical protein DWV06_15400 [Anaerosacchariphilus polymeriproducens]|uniref:Uncharacterized protein n=1 Tax=Anaerosacchariphilus polymeriproducens TaxID=1812858 RepID=A0A371ASV1_9FIRM|nr:hypothetical protein DWV06_15400 [Anaerosacchariphilus polymeriproducens]
MADKFKKKILVDETKKYFLNPLPHYPLFKLKVKENIVVNEKPILQLQRYFLFMYRYKWLVLYACKVL